MENVERYRHLNTYLKEKFGQRTLKICIDGGFTCPNRDGTLGKDGCIYCSQKGSGEHIQTNSIGTHAVQNIKKQILAYFKSYKAERANCFIVYFQNFTNTYDTLENLKMKYDAALIDKKIVGLQIATRPDCINPEIVQLLSTYTKSHYVCVELGLQTSNNIIGMQIKRGYTSEDFTKAVKLLNAYHIDVVAHMMVGLPHETMQDIENTVHFLNQHPIQGLKIHNVYVLKNTALADLYEQGLYEPISLHDYFNCLSYILTHLRPDIVIHRISGDAPKDLLLAPEWNTHKKWILNGIEKILKENDLYQGMYV